VHELNRKMLRLWVKMPNARTLAPAQRFPGTCGCGLNASACRQGSLTNGLWPRELLF
jgi:hypothetical protein